jgi:chromosome segregation ATPase
MRRSLADKLKKLQEALDDRKLAFNALSAKNTLLEADITVAKQQYDDAQNQIKRMEIDQEQLTHKIRRECKQEKDVKFIQFE